jgi:hypothetical protein
MKKTEICKMSWMALTVLGGISFIVTMYDFFTAPSIYILPAFFTVWFWQMALMFGMLHNIYDGRHE